jgi:hypothetical protein
VQQAVTSFISSANASSVAGTHREATMAHRFLDAIALSIEVPFIFDCPDSHPLCPHEAFFKAQSYIGGDDSKAIFCVNRKTASRRFSKMQSGEIKPVSPDTQTGRCRPRG